MKSILTITSWFPTDFEPVRCVFVENILKNQIEQSREFEYQIIVPIPKYYRWIPKRINPKYHAFSLIPEQKNRIGTSVYYPKYFKLPSPFLERYEWVSYLQAVRKNIKKYNLKFDLVHSHGLYPDGIASLMIASEYGVPFIQHVHDSSLGIVTGWKKEIYRKILAAAEKNIAVSFEQRKRITSIINNKLPSNTEVVYNGVDTNLFRPTKLSAKIIPDLEKSIRIISVGNLIHRKGFDILVDTVAKLKSLHVSVKFTIIGEGPERLSLMKQIEYHNCQENIILKGEILNNNLPEELRENDIFVLATRSETFGIVFLEAIACGLPVIAPKIKPLTEFINDKCGIFAVPEDPDSFAQAIIMATSKKWNPELIANEASQYSIEHCARKLNEIYTEILITQ